MSSIFKFMSGEDYHIEALKNDNVYFSKFTDLNDPYEGLLHFSYKNVTDSIRMTLYANGLAKEGNISLSEGRKKAERLRQKEGIEKVREIVNEWTEIAFEDYRHFHLENRFVLSVAIQKEDDLFPAPLTSMMMWSHYAKGMRGLCVEFDYQKLLDSIQTLNELDVSTRLVSYSNKHLPRVCARTVIEDFIKDNGKAGLEMINAFCTKHSGWSYENELRFLGSKHGLVNYDTSAVKRIFVGHKNKALLQTVKEIVRSKNLNVPVYTVNIRPKTYGLGFVEAI